MNRKIGVILSYVMMIFEVLSTLLLTPFIIRTLGQAEYGVYKLSAAIVTYLLLLDLGVGNAVVRYVAKYRATGDVEQNRKFLGIATIYYLIIAVVVILIGIVLIAIFPTVFAEGLTASEKVLGQKLLLITTINSAITLGTSAYSNIIVAYEKFSISKGVAIIETALRIVFTYLALKLGMGSVGIVLINLSMTILGRGVYIVYVLFKLKLRPKFTGIEFSFLKEVLGYSSLILLQMVATQINAYVDQVLLGMLVPVSAVIIGIYAVGAQIVQYFQIIGSSVTGILMPSVVRIVENGAKSEELCQEMIRVGRIIFIALAFIWVCFLFYGKQFINLWAGTENAEAFPVALLLMFAHIFILTESIGTQILWAKNAHKEQSILKIIIVVSNIILTIFLIKWKPLMGATIGTFISLLLGDIVVMNIIFRKKIGISLRKYYSGLFTGIIPCLILSGAVGYLFGLLQLNGWLGFVCNIGIMIVVYGSSMLLFGFNNYEKSLIYSIVKKIFKRRKNNELIRK